MGALRFLVDRFRGSPSTRHFFRSLALGTKGGTSTVRSADGTEISVRRSGTGPAVVMVHGTLDGMSGWSFVEPPLADEFTVWVYDRRGRGGSGDTDPWAIDREVDDLAAVIEASGEPAHVVAHSFGAVVAMLARLSGVPMRSLVLYEPPMNSAEISKEHTDEVSRRLDAGDRDGAITAMTTKLAGVSDEELGVALRIPPVRNTLREGTRSAPRELAALRELEWTDLPIVDTPTLLMRGELSDTAAYPRQDQLASLAEDIDVVELAGQRHLANTFAPEEFVASVAGFIRRHS